MYFFLNLIKAISISFLLKLASSRAELCCWLSLKTSYLFLGLEGMQIGFCKEFRFE